MGEGKSFEQAPPSEPFDKEWYDRFEKAGSFQAYEYLGGEKDYRQEQRVQFEAGTIENPTLDYPKLKPEELQQKEESLLSLKTDIIGHPTEGLPQAEKMEVVKQVYRWRLNEKLAEVRMLQAAEQGDIRRFKRYSEFIYGRPSPDVFAYTVNSVRDNIAGYLNSDNPDLRQAAEELAATLPDTLPSPSVTALPSKETAVYAKEQTMQELGNLILIPEGEGEVDASGIKQSFETALTTLKSDGWNVVIDRNKSAVSVNQEKQAVQIPEHRRMKPQALAGLIVHEIGTHVARRESGERTRLKLLGLGLDRYEGGEEGVATMRQQAVEGNVEDFAGLEGHLAISLAQGLDGTPRDFRQVYEVMRKYHLVQELAAGKDASVAQKAAAQKAWARSVRTFRGADCKTPGAVFTKDIIYREGNMGVWDLVRTKPEEMQRFNIGKYDPTNSRHIWILTQLGITDGDLSELKK